MRKFYQTLAGYRSLEMLIPHVTARVPARFTYHVGILLESTRMQEEFLSLLKPQQDLRQARECVSRSFKATQQPPIAGTWGVVRQPIFNSSREQVEGFSRFESCEVILSKIQS